MIHDNIEPTWRFVPEFVLLTPSFTDEPCFVRISDILHAYRSIEEKTKEEFTRVVLLSDRHNNVCVRETPKEILKLIGESIC